MRFILSATVVMVIPDKANAFLCFSPFLLIGTTSMAAGVMLKQVWFADRARPSCPGSPSAG